MFAGIVEHAGTVAAVRNTAGGRRLSIEAGPVAEGVREGASIAVDGVCLTIAAARGQVLEFDVIAETLRRSTLERLQVGHRVNLERSLRAGDRVDGHFVQGHIDAVAVVSRRQAGEREWMLWFRTSPETSRYIIPKGSIAVSGVSLTVASAEGEEFAIALIPTTLARTTLVDLKEGEAVNIETDILARTVVHTLERMNASAGGITEAMLREHGYS